MIEITYNSPSDFGSGWSSGSTRFSSEQEFMDWLVLKLTLGPVLVTTIKRRSKEAVDVSKAERRAYGRPENA